MDRSKPPQYGDSMWAALEQSLQQAPERLDPETLDRVCTRLLARSAEQQALLVRNSGLTGRIQVCHRLVEIAEEHRFGDPATMLQAAQAAVVVAAALAQDHSGALIHDALAEAWGCLANSLRIHGDLDAADRAWAEVSASLEHTSGDPLLRGKLLELEATLRSERQQYEEARRLFLRAQRLYEGVEDRHLAGRTLLSQAHSAFKAGDLDRAIEAAFEGGKRIDVDRDPRMRAIAMFNLVHYLAEAEQSQEALNLLRVVAPLCERLPHADMHCLRMRWMEGRLQAAIDLPDDAARLLESVRADLLARELEYEAALASLDLAAVYAEIGHTHRVQKLARDCYPIFASSKIPREASATLLLFAKAAREEALTAAAIRATASKLRHQQ